VARVEKGSGCSRGAEFLGCVALAGMVRPGKRRRKKKAAGKSGEEIKLKRSL